jgi:hypothetical protein
MTKIPKLDISNNLVHIFGDTLSQEHYNYYRCLPCWKHTSLLFQKANGGTQSFITFSSETEASFNVPVVRPTMIWVWIVWIRCRQFTFFPSPTEGRNKLECLSISSLKNGFGFVINEYKWIAIRLHFTIHNIWSAIRWTIMKVILNYLPLPSFYWLFISCRV